MMLIDKQVLIETNKKLKELFFSMDEAKKLELSRRFMKLPEDESPHRIHKWSLNDVWLLKAYISESPSRRKKLVKFSPSKIDLDLLIFRSYFFLEYSFFLSLQYYKYTLKADDPVQIVCQVGHASEDNKIVYGAFHSALDPRATYAGSFFLAEYPYDEILEAILKPIDL